MRRLEILPRGKPARILCIGAHSDDIEIGAGGTILGWIAGGAQVDVRWCIASSPDAREAEARASANAFLSGASSFELVFGDLRDGRLPSDYPRAKDWVETLAAGPRPDVILTHRHDDAHQDHRLLCELTWNTFRDDLILEYEIPKWDGDLGRPNLYIPVDKTVLDRKVSLLERHFSSQRSKDWFDEETFRGLARIRGIECRTQYAEAFWARKMLMA
jgi:LmbE family N-acetylglucosaminyl deacetylase